MNNMVKDSEARYTSRFNDLTLIKKSTYVMIKLIITPVAKKEIVIPKSRWLSGKYLWTMT